MTTQDLVHTFERCINKYTSSEKKPRSYGTEILLTRVEVHTIDSIGKNNGINVTQLALYQGVTKGAISQMIDKLSKKELVIKSLSPKTENEVVLELTTRGWIVYAEHMKYHEIFYKKLETLIGQLPKESLQVILAMSTELEKLLDPK